MAAWFGSKGKDSKKPESPAAKAAQGNNQASSPDSEDKILIVTEEANKKIKELIGNTTSPVLGVRVLAEAPSPANPQYSLAFVQDGEQYEDDNVLEFDGIKVFIDPDSMPHMKNVRLDFSMAQGMGGFRLDRLSSTALGSAASGPVADRVRAIIKDQINPALALHGGFVDLIDVKGSTAYVELGGGCKGCGMVDVTLKQGIETMIKQNVPEITEILDSTDHASGQNPYYQASK